MGARHYKLSDERAKRMDAGSIELEGDSGRVFVVPPPDLLTDAQQGALQKAQADEDLVGLGRALLGDEYDDFAADGGSASLLFAIYGETVGDVGESSASSNS